MSTWEQEENRARRERQSLPYGQDHSCCGWTPIAHEYWKSMGYRDGMKWYQGKTAEEIAYGLAHYTDKAHRGPSASYEAGLRDACRHLVHNPGSHIVAVVRNYRHGGYDTYTSAREAWMNAAIEQDPGEPND